MFFSMGAKEDMKEASAPAPESAVSSGTGKSSATTADILQLLACSSDGVYAVDGKQRIIFWSEAAEDLLRCPASRALGKYCYEIVLGRDYAGHPFCRRDCPTIRAARRGQGVGNFDISCWRDGEDVWLNVSIVPVPRSVAGGPGAIHLIRDVSKRRRSEQLAQAAIQTVSEFMAESPRFEAEHGPYPAPEPRLTDREIEVLRLLADGLGTQALAKQLGVSKATVRNHVQRLLAKLGAHNRLEAVLYGARHRLM